jgi:acyl carrier protein
MSIKLAITSQMQKIADERNDKLAPLTDDLNLLDSGLDSLGFAILVARLEDELGCDPFTESDEIRGVRWGCASTYPLSARPTL